MKLIIDIPEEMYESCKRECEKTDVLIIDAFTFAIGNGTPLDSDSEQDEVQAYYAGMSYGWEEGRKDLIDDVKAEIDRQEFTHHNGLTHWYMTPSEVKSVVFEIIDKYIGKAESEGK